MLERTPPTGARSAAELPSAPILVLAGQFLEVGGAVLAWQIPQEEDAQEGGAAVGNADIGLGQPSLQLGAPRVSDAVLAAVARAGAGDLDQAGLAELAKLTVDLALLRGPDEGERGLESPEQVLSTAGGLGQQAQDGVTQTHGPTLKLSDDISVSEYL
ncbi:hypothetical protein Srufu_045400 [Streptomyces libani subsp. rufus]|nr:hypothetical protein Srufu_045400 [Streptomyces libani subsp. rufus]